MRDDPRYAAGAYIFVRMALDYTVKKLSSNGSGRPDRNVSSRELLDGAAEFALESFGPMAMTLFEEWGVKSCSDIGEIVFNLVEAGELRKTDDDKLEDFDGVFDFKDVFVKPFLPSYAK